MPQARLHLLPDRFINVIIDAFLLCGIDDARNFRRDHRYRPVRFREPHACQHLIRVTIECMYGDDITHRLVRRPPADRDANHPVQTDQFFEQLIRCGGCNRDFKRAVHDYFSY